MSKYVIVEVDMTDGDCIKDALKNLGYQCEEHQEAQQLEGFEGKMREQTAHIIVRRKYVNGASNDVGFKKNKNGKYDLLISDYDKSNRKTKVDFLEKLQQGYGASKVKKQIKSMGMTVLSQKTDNKGRLRIRVMA